MDKSNVKQKEDLSEMIHNIFMDRLNKINQDIDKLEEKTTGEGTGKSKYVIDELNRISIINKFVSKNNIEGRNLQYILNEFLIFLKGSKENIFKTEIKKEFRCSICESDFENELECIDCFSSCAFDSCKKQFGGVLPVEKTLDNKGNIISEEICK